MPTHTYIMRDAKFVWVCAIMMVAGVGCGEVGDGASGAGAWGNGVCAVPGTCGDGNGGDGDGSDGSGPSDGSGTGGGGGNGTVCDEVSVTGSKVPPNVLVLLDRSGSMGANINGSGASKWAQAQAAINDTTSGLDGQVDFGLGLFPAPGARACETGRVVLNPAPNSGGQIATIMSGDSPSGATPAANSIRSAASSLADLGGGTIVLVTDGAPNCSATTQPVNRCRCTNPNAANAGVCGWNQRDRNGNLVGIAPSSDACDDSSDSADAIAAAAAAGIRTYVVGFSLDGWDGELDLMAAAGGTELNSHVPTDDQAALRSALSSIAEGTIGCAYQLQETPKTPENITVSIDGNRVPHNSSTSDGSGFVISGNTVTLVGSTCDSLNDSSQIDIVVTCEKQFEPGGPLL